MKTFIRILFLGLLVLPICAFAQKATDQKEFQMKVRWDDLDGYSERISYKVPIYYDNDDNAIKHGPLKINFKRDLSAQVRQKCIISHNISGNYVNGKLNGVLSVEQVITVTQGSLKIKGILNFVNGIPTGTWKFTKIGTMGNKSETIASSATFKDSLLVSYNDGKNNFTINNDGKFSGTLNGDVYKNNLKTNKFIRKTGETTTPDETAQSLINNLISGTISESDLITKGFALEKHRGTNSIDIDDIFCDLRINLEILGINSLMNTERASYVTVGRTTEEILKKEGTCTLKRVNLISAEELTEKASSIKNATYVKNEAHRIYWETDNIEYEHEFNTNKIYISRNLYYFTDDAKSKIEIAIKEAIEERRKEQERIAEEQRKEQERIAEGIIRKQTQPICDYLVEQRTSLNISYDDKASVHFDSSGLEEPWRLNLSKAIKPFCKIVDCKIVDFKIISSQTYDYATYGFDAFKYEIEAILDITKYNKKGNITYRIPVTIVDGRILITSLNFSKATVIE